MSEIQQEEEARKLYRTGRAYYRNGNYQDSQEKLLEASKRDPRSQNIHEKLGDLFKKTNRFHESVNHYKLAYAADQELYFHFKACLVILDNDNDFKGIINQENKAENYEALEKSKVFLRTDHQYEAEYEYVLARQKYQQFLRREFKFDTQLLFYKFLYELKRRFEFCLENFHPEFYNQQPYNEVFFYLGCVMSYAEIYDEALRMLDRSLKFDVNHFEAYCKIGEIYFYQNKFDQALQFFNECLQINPLYVLAYKHISLIHELRNQQHLSKKFQNKMEQIMQQHQITLPLDPRQGLIDPEHTMKEQKAREDMLQKVLMKNEILTKIAQSLFLTADKDGSQYLDPQQLLAVLQKFCIQMQIQPITEKEMVELLNKYDENKDGQIQQTQFILMASQIYESRKKEKLISSALQKNKDLTKIAQKLFDKFDADQSGFLDYQEVKNLVLQLTDELRIQTPSPDNIFQLFRTLDSSHDNQINFQETKHLIASYYDQVELIKDGVNIFYLSYLRIQKFLSAMFKREKQIENQAKLFQLIDDFVHKFKLEEPPLQLLEQIFIETRIHQNNISEDDFQEFLKTLLEQWMAINQNILKFINQEDQLTQLVVQYYRKAKVPKIMGGGDQNQQPEHNKQFYKEMIENVFAQYQVRLPQPKQYDTLWLKIDQDGDGSLSEDQFMEFILEHLEQDFHERQKMEDNYKQYKEIINILDQQFQAVDSNQNGLLDKKEFLVFFDIIYKQYQPLMKEKLSLKRPSDKLLLDQFNESDTNFDQKLSFFEFRELFFNLSDKSNEERSQATQQLKKDKKLFEFASDMFRQYDKDDSNSLSIEQFTLAMNEINKKFEIFKFTMESKFIQSKYQEIDTDDNGGVTISQFYKCIIHLKNYSEEIQQDVNQMFEFDKELNQYALAKFKEFDTDNSQKLDYQEFEMAYVQIADGLNLQIPTRTQLLQRFRDVDVSGDGKVTFNQFRLLLKILFDEIKQFQQELMSFYDKYPAIRDKIDVLYYKIVKGDMTGLTSLQVNQLIHTVCQEERVFLLRPNSVDFVLNQFLSTKNDEFTNLSTIFQIFQLALMNDQADTKKIQSFYREFNGLQQFIEFEFQQIPKFDETKLRDSMDNMLEFFKFNMLAEEIFQDTSNKYRNEKQELNLEYKDFTVFLYDYLQKIHIRNYDIQRGNLLYKSEVYLKIPANQTQFDIMFKDFLQDQHILYEDLEICLERQKKGLFNITTEISNLIKSKLTEIKLIKNNRIQEKNINTVIFYILEAIGQK